MGFSSQRITSMIQFLSSVCVSATQQSTWNLRSDVIDWHHSDKTDIPNHFTVHPVPFLRLTRGSFREGTGSSSHIRQLGQVMDKLGFGALRANLIKSEADDGQQPGPAQSKAAKKALKNADHLLR